MLLSLLLNITNLLGNLLQGVLVSGVLKLKVCSRKAVSHLYGRLRTIDKDAPLLWTLGRTGHENTDLAASSQLLVAEPSLLSELEAVATVSFSEK